MKMTRSDPGGLCSARWSARTYLAGLAVGALFATAASAAKPPPPVPDTARTSAVRQSLLELPLSFEPNVGQTDGSVKFLSRAGGISLYLTPGAAVLALKGSGSNAAAVRMELVGANPAATMAGSAELPGKANYLHGSDPTRDRKSVV